MVERGPEQVQGREQEREQEQEQEVGALVGRIAEDGTWTKVGDEKARPVEAEWRGLAGSWGSVALG